MLAWSEPEPAAGQNMATATTALTHPKMFGFFDKRKYEDYAFQHMVSLGTAIIYTSERIQTQLMLPWLQCVLTEVSRTNKIGFFLHRMISVLHQPYRGPRHRMSI